MLYTRNYLLTKFHQQQRKLTMQQIRRSYTLIFSITAALLLLAGCNGKNTLSNEEKVTSDLKISQSKTLLILHPLNDAESENLLAEGVNTQSVSEPQALKVVFPSSQSISALSVVPDDVWDLSALPPHNIAFEAKNLSDESVHLYLRIENADGKSQKHSYSMPVGYDGTIFVPIKGLEAETETGFWGDLPIWPQIGDMMVWRSWRSAQVDLSQIAKLEFSMIGVLNDKTLQLSNVRIRQNPPSDPQWTAGIVDEFGQNALRDFPNKIKSLSQLKQAADEELAYLDNSTGPENRSQFGGYTAGPKLEATGFFRTEKVNGKWWMVDPQGNVFFSHGPANVRMANMTTLTGIDYDAPEIKERRLDETTPEDSMGIIAISDEAKSKRYFISELRNKMFNWLPKYDDPLAEHYSYRRSTHKGAIPHGETYSFYRANLDRRYGNDGNYSFLKKWHDVTVDRMRDWGFTSFGNWVDPSFFASKEIPYFANGWIIGDFKTLSGYKNHWGLMPDPFDPVFAQRAKVTIEEVAANVKNSPWCVGIFIDNEKSWGEREGSVPQRYGIILDALSKNSDESPASKAFTSALEQKYENINALNNAWSTNISDWSSLKKGINFESYTDELVSDLSTLLEMLGEQYFTVVHDTLADTMPNHLYMGARMANWGMPDEIIKASLKYSDVLSFNIYEEGVQEHAWAFLEEVDLPVVVGEFHIGTATDSGLFNPGIVHASDQKDRAKMYTQYMKSVLDKPYMVGAHWFQYADEPITGRAFDGENANIGLVTVTDMPYPELSEAIKEITYSMYEERLEE